MGILLASGSGWLSGGMAFQKIRSIEGVLASMESLLWVKVAS
jgi:hypothetical protein